MRLLITGASGFIGRQLVIAAARLGHEVTAIARRARPLDLAAAVVWMQADLSEAGAWMQQLEAQDAIIHAAGYAHAGQGEAILHQRHNLQLTQNLVSLAQHWQVKRFVFLSSIKAANIDSDYARAKSLAEQYVIEELGSTGCCLRLALVYGPGVKGHLALLARMANKGFLPNLHMRKPNRRAMVSIYDVVQAVFLTLQKTPTASRVYTVTDNQEYSSSRIFHALNTAYQSDKNYAIAIHWIKPLASMLAAMQKVCPPLRRISSAAVQGLWQDAWHVCPKIRDELGFVPEYCFEQVAGLLLEPPIR